MRRFSLEGLLELLFQFGIVLIPLLLALIGPLIAKLVRKGSEPKRPGAAGGVRPGVPGGERPGVPGGDLQEARRLRAEADLEGTMRHVDQGARAEPAGRQVQDERTVIEEIRRLMENRAREAADERPAQEGQGAARREAARVKEMQGVKGVAGVKGRRRAAPLEERAVRTFQSVSDRMDEHQAQSLEARGALRDAEVGSAAQATKAGLAVVRVRPAATFGRILRQDPAFVLLAAEVFGPCRAAAGIEGSPMAPASLRPWG